MRPQQRPQSQHRGRSAALFVDLDDLYSALQNKLPQGTDPAAFVLDALRAIPGFAGRAFSARLQSTRAYADFAALPDGAELQKSLYTAYAESVYVCGPRNAAELALAMDAAVLMEAQPDVGLLVVVSGTRTYSPLVRRARALGRRVVVLTTEAAREREGEGDVVSVFDLAPEAQTVAAPRVPREGIDYKRIESATGLRVLEVIEEYFGQYDEVYLTPLLRKLTEELGEGHEPKGLISDLEALGAVYLEKRRGYPHDYTVLLVDEQHPDVQRVRALFEDEDEDDAYESNGAYASDEAVEEQ
jgi:hypothetical protein